jgi:ribosomal peptide maturation radical SAM protein 1
MKVALVSMPWCDFGMPSAALGALSAYIRTRMPQISLTCHSEHLEIYRRLGPDVYLIFRNNRILGESLYLSTLFPEYCGAVKRAFVERAAAEEGDAPGPAEFGRSWEDLFDKVRECLVEHRDALAETLAVNADVVGLTTSLSQTFSSLSLARRIREIAPGTCIILGGAAVEGAKGRVVLEEFDCVDYVIDGEGEVPFERLLTALEKGRSVGPGLPGIIGRDAPGSPSTPDRWEVPGLDELPFPDYDEYAQKADDLSIIWNIPVEGSRGCWWDRTARSGNPLDRCYFCNYGGRAYREKSAARVGREVARLTRRYRNVRVAFCENAVRPRGIVDLAASLRRRRGEFSIFMSLRANTSARDILNLYEAGVMRCECGIEGLSNSYLSRLNKGTTVIRNLQVLRTCHELGIWNNTNLIVNFPGATGEEVEETAANIRDYAAAYYPPGRTISFQLTPGCAVDIFRDRYGIEDVRNLEDYRCGMPPETGERLVLGERTWTQPEPVDWQPVESACADWGALHENLRKDDRFPVSHPLYYHDGGSFLEIVDRRDGCRTITLPGPWRSVYLFCMEIRTQDRIAGHFPVSVPPVAEILEWLVAEKLMYREKRLYLSLAIALTPGLAVRRMKGRK